MNPRNNLHLGILGENIAIHHLKSQKYKILERNFKNRYGDIDIVAMEGQILVFVEVKTRIGDKYGKGEETINQYKIKTMEKYGQYYILKKNPKFSSIRLDFISISLDSEQNVKEINIYKNISG